MARQHRKLPILSTQDIGRFWSKIDKSLGQGPNGECWEWQASRLHDGYAQISVQGENFYAHRIAYLIQFRVDPGGQLVCHTCDNRACCRGDHFFLGDDKANTQDCIRKGRFPPPSYCGAKGVNHFKAKLTEEQVRAIRTANAQGATEHALARIYGVSRSTIHHICSRRSWKHIP